MKTRGCVSASSSHPSAGLRSRGLKADSVREMEPFPSGEYCGSAALPAGAPRAGSGARDRDARRLRGRPAQPPGRGAPGRAPAPQGPGAAGPLSGSCLPRGTGGRFLVLASPWSAAWKLPQFLFYSG